MAPLGGLGTWIQAFSGYWPRLGFWENHQGGESHSAKVCRRLLYTEDEVMKSLDMASKALHHKNHVIHALQLKILAMEESTHVLDTPLEDKPWEIKSTTAVQNENKTLEALRIQLAKAEEALALAHVEIKEKEETIQELAHMLASREASQMALIETVQSYIAQQCGNASLPATPRSTATDSTGMENYDTDATQSQLEAIIERLHAQAEIGTMKLRAVGLHKGPAEDEF